MKQWLTNILQKFAALRATFPRTEKGSQADPTGFGRLCVQRLKHRVS